MRLLSFRALLSAAVVGVLGSAVHAGTVPAIQFYDGNPLYVQSVVGTGPDTAYLVVDLASGPDVAWQYNFDPTSGPVNAWQMLSAVETADPSLSITAPYYAAYSEHYVENFQYGPAVGALYQWDFDSGTYNSANVSSSNPQGTTWNTGIDVGIDQVDLANNELIGFVDVYPDAPLPVLPETQAAVPEPASISLALMASGLLLRRRRR